MLGAEAEKERYEATFNQRARWRMMRHVGPDADGATRWRCPFCAGLLRARKFPKTLRRSKTLPLVPVDEGCDRCCDGVLTAQATEVALLQRITYGTTAWRISMEAPGRGVVNAALKGAFADLARGFFRVVGTTKMTVMMGFTLGVFNLDRIRSFRAKHGLSEYSERAERPKKKRARRRTGTWADVVERVETPPPE